MPRNVWVVVQCDREPHSELSPVEVKDLKSQIRAELRDAWAPVIVLPPGCHLDQMHAPGDDEDDEEEDGGGTQVLGRSGEDDPDGDEDEDDMLPAGG